MGYRMTGDNVFDDREVLKRGRQIRERARKIAKVSQLSEHWDAFHLAREMMELALTASRDNVRTIELPPEMAALMREPDAS
jgi:hypothetical protein